MFQSGKQRERADEQHICVRCLKQDDCRHKGDMESWYGWRYILTFCAVYEGLKVVEEPK